MYGGYQQPTKAELQAQADAANAVLVQGGALCVFLYLAPMALDYVKKLV